MKRFFKILGPGLLYAGAAIGVSHLVQSTRAGAMFNFDMLWVLIAANLLKYPFFDFGVRYATATNENLVNGYARIGKWAVVLFTVLTIASMFIIQAAVTVVTAGLFAYIFHISISVTALTAIILIIAILTLAFGKYSFLDKLMKWIIVLLSISTVVAVFAAFGIHKTIDPNFLTSFEWTNKADIFFLIAFVGWMPAPIDISVWSSIWNIEKTKELGFTPNLKEALAEFRFGYIGTAILAMGFLSLGALIMYGTGQQLSPKGTTFAGQLIHMYTTSIGSWSYWIISIAAFTTMLSTTITVLDAYSRVLTPVSQYFIPKWKKIKETTFSGYWLALMLAGTLVIILFFATSMHRMVDMATTLSFVFSPALAWLNYRAVTNKSFPDEAKPGWFLKILSWLGILFFIVFTLVYLGWRYFI
jgi:Mn2+/Fe2+ NRAMP family transporter